MRCTAATRARRFVKQFPVLLWLVWAVAVISAGLLLDRHGVFTPAPGDHAPVNRAKLYSGQRDPKLGQPTGGWAKWNDQDKPHAQQPQQYSDPKYASERPAAARPPPPPPPPPPPRGDTSAAIPQSWRPHMQPVSLDLKLSGEILGQPALASHDAMFHKYGFNLNLSNHIPLAHDWPDYRNDACKQRVYPAPAEMQKVSVIIIFYNEPLSTLLRNAIGVLNRSPPELLGEILLVDDHSQMDEHVLLDEHVARLQAKLPAGKVRLVRREVHNGIVGARIRGAEEAIYPIIVFLDSHAEVCKGWLEPLVYRIHGDPTRVIIPNIRGININTMELIPGGTWPPSRGTFTWRLSFSIVLADSRLDVLETDVDPKSSATKTPVMPGGLFAMDRKFFFKIGAYDPEIMYYGAEHVELSFRAWMCGGSMEVMPCSNVGHIYREFDRFGVDPQLKGVNIGKFLNRNDARVAEVWLDEYKDIYFGFRPKAGLDLGDLSDRVALRRRVCPKPFSWYLKEVVRDHYVPDKAMRVGAIASLAPGGTGVLDPSGGPPIINMCMDSAAHFEGPVAAKRCGGRRSQTQQLTFTSNGYLQTTQHYHHNLICVRVELVSQVPCDAESCSRWKIGDDGLLRSLDQESMCLERGSQSGDVLKYRSCVADGAKLHQKWEFRQKGLDGTLSGPDFDVCIDNMQKSSGAPGMYSCHGYGTQRWTFTPDGKIKSTQHHDGAGVCIGFEPVLRLYKCIPDDPDYQWRWIGGGGGESGRLESIAAKGRCIELDMDGTSTGDQPLRLGECADGNDRQKWEFKV